MEPRKSQNNPPANHRDLKNIKGRKAFMLKIALMILSPLLFLGVVEGMLWGLGFGRPSSFFIEWETEKEKVYLANADFSLQFVPPELLRESNEIILQPGSSRSRKRIFVLGGSAAAGDPDPAFGFSRILELLLNECSKGPSFEVVNAAVTSMNSHVVRHIAGDCAEHEPDAFIIYMGNNEVVGPYGPPSLPSSLYASTRFIRGMIFLKGTRAGQLVSSLMQPKKVGTGKWQGMEAFLAYQFPLGHEKLEYCYAHFKANIRDIIRIAEDAHVKTILCTVPVNIRSCAPFGSMHTQDLDRHRLDRWQALFDSGRTLQDAGDFAGALEKYRSAQEIDDHYADLAFSMGECNEVLGDYKNAKQLYIRARDLDTLRFRADSRINAVIRRIAEESPGKSVLLLDLEKILSAHSDNGLLGEDVLVDHVHLNFRANVLAALAAMRALDGLYDDATFNYMPEEFANLHQFCRERLLYDMQAEYGLAMKMYLRKTRPPFVNQLDHQAEMASLRRTLIDLRTQLKLLNSDNSAREYFAAAEKAPFDGPINQRLGEFWTSHGKVAQAIGRYEDLLSMFPYNATIRVALARALATAGRADEAIGLLTSPENPRKWDRKKALLFIGGTLVRSNQIQKAVEVYEEVVRLDPEQVDALVNLGIAAKQQDPEEAIEFFHRALKIDPHCVDAMLNLGNAYVAQKKPAEAEKWYRKAIAENPAHHLPHFGLGLELLKQGNIAESLEHIEQSVHLYPEFINGYEVLEYIYRQQGREQTADTYGNLAALYQN